MSEKRKEYFDAIIDWFQVSREDSDKIVCYVNAEYDLKMSVEQPQWCYLIIKESEAVYLRRQDFMEGAELLPGGQPWPEASGKRPCPQPLHIRGKRSVKIYAGSGAASDRWPGHRRNQ